MAAVELGRRHIEGISLKDYFLNDPSLVRVKDFYETVVKLRLVLLHFFWGS